MPRKVPLTAILAALAALAAAGPARADEVAGPMSIRPPLAERGPAPIPPRAYRHRHAPAAAMPPEQRYRDPRTIAQRHPAPLRRGPSFAGPPDLIHAYLPRYTELPMYNEPPTRFPAHW